MAAAADPLGPVQYPSTSGMETSDMWRSLNPLSSMVSIPASRPFTGPTNEYDSRPDFLDMAALKEEFACPLCQQVLINPQQTPCGGRACAVCLRNKFGSNTSIQCPLPHDPDEDMSLEECQRDGGLKLDDITPDASVQRVLLKKKCYCPNREYGCPATPTWIKLPEHHLTCAFKPVRCDADLCEKMFPESQRAIHEEKDCNFVPVRCQYCNREMLRGELEEHKLRCQRDCNACHDAHAFKRAGGKKNTKSLSSNCERPDFVRRMRLLDKYDCAICRDICLGPHQTLCGTLVCKECFNEKVAVKGTIPCPCKGNANDCNGDSLQCGDINPDRRILNKLLQEACFCRNKKYGCTVQPSWSKLKIHEESCVHAPVRCRNSCCNEKIPRCDLEDHMSNCADKLQCITEQEDPFQDQLEFHCTQCHTIFATKIELDIHERTEPSCIKSPGKCFYHKFCRFETLDVEELRDHHRSHVPAHSAYLAALLKRSKIVSITRHSPHCIANPVSGEDEVKKENRAQQAWDGPQPGRNLEE